MDQLLAEKKEALEVAADYMDKLIPGIGTLCIELRGSRQDDTDTFCKQCIDGLNWMIEVYNRTSDLLEAEKISVQKQELNEGLRKLAEAVQEKNEIRIAELLESAAVPFLKDFQEAAMSAAAKL